VRRGGGSRRRSGGEKPLGESVLGLLDHLSLGAATRGALAIVRWPEFVGPLAAEHARAQHVRRGVLTVAVDSAVWATELSTHIPVLLERIGSALGSGVVTDVCFVVGRRAAWGRSDRGESASGSASEPWSLTSESRVWPDRRDLASVSLSDREHETLREVAAAIRDPELAQAAGRWAALTLKAGRWLAEQTGRCGDGT
jgi:hypothetical protein